MAQVEDFYRSAVPESERRSFAAIVFPLIGYVFIFAVVLAGGKLGAGLGLADALIAAAIAALVLGVLAGIDGIIAADTGLSFGLLVRHSFGQVGSWLPNVLIPAVLVTWFGISVSFVADVFVKVYGGNFTFYVLAMSVVFIASAYFGIKVLVLLSYPIVLFSAAMGIALIVGPIWQAGGVAPLIALAPIQPISSADAITLAVGSFATGGTTASLNILRFSRTPMQGAAAGFISMGLGFFFVLLIGIVGLKAAGSADVVEIGRAIGLYHLGVWMLILLTWTTLDKSLYSSSLTFSASSGIPRSRVVLILGAIGIVLGLWRSIDFIMPWLRLLGIVIPPLMGIIQADYWMARLRGRRWGDGDQFPAVDLGAILAWLVAVAVAFWGQSQSWPLSPALVAILVAVALRALSAPHLWRKSHSSTID